MGEEEDMEGIVLALLFFIDPWITKKEERQIWPRGGSRGSRGERRTSIRRRRWRGELDSAGEMAREMAARSIRRRRGRIGGGELHLSQEEGKGGRGRSSRVMRPCSSKESEDGASYRSWQR